MQEWSRNSIRQVAKIVHKSSHAWAVKGRWIYTTGEDTLRAGFRIALVLHSEVRCRKWPGGCTRFVFFRQFEKLIYLRRYWTDFKKFGSFETAKFS